MSKATVHLEKRVDNSYNIVIEKNLMGKIPGYLKKEELGNEYAIITDSNIEKIFGKKLLKDLNKKGLNACLLSFKAGERNKNLKTAKYLLEQMLKKGLDRNSAVIALGGGVVGDLAGFVAASYMRGIPYIQVPTSLLAMVDSSIGGKVAVDLEGGKNSCGAFYQPKKVFIDISALKSLPEAELKNGMAEVVKHAMIADKKLFVYLEKNLEGIFKRNEPVLEKIIKRNCEIKARIVEKDEKEKNLRKVVNYGHTIGHAIEVLTNYKKFTHGEAIAIGMNYEARIAEKLGYLGSREVERQNLLLKRIGLRIKMPEFSAKELLRVMRKDKKAVGGKIQIVLPKNIGAMKTVNGQYGLNVSEKIIAAVLGEKR